MSLLVFIGVNFAFIGIVSLVGLFALERAMVSETWRRWLYMATGVTAAALALCLVVGMIDDWAYATPTYIGSFAIVAVWLRLRRMTDSESYRNQEVQEDMVSDGVGAPVRGFRSYRNSDQDDSSGDSTPVFIRRGPRS